MDETCTQYMFMYIQWESNQMEVRDLVCACGGGGGGGGGFEYYWSSGVCMHVYVCVY